MLPMLHLYKHISQAVTLATGNAASPTEHRSLALVDAVPAEGIWGVFQHLYLRSVAQNAHHRL